MHFTVDTRKYLPDQIKNTALGYITTADAGFPTMDDIKNAVVEKNPTTASQIN
jgi:hypothetical protein